MAEIMANTLQQTAITSMLAFAAFSLFFLLVHELHVQVRLSLSTHACDLRDVVCVFKVPTS